jgi:hypothetical protein
MLCFCILEGDSGYPCRSWLLTPFPNPTEDYQKLYNTAHRKTRVVVECSFGKLKRQWNILHEGLRMPVARAPKVIGVCFMLRNMAIDKGLGEEYGDGIPPQENDVAQGEGLLQLLNDDHYIGPMTVADRHRSLFASKHFRF